MRIALGMLLALLLCHRLADAAPPPLTDNDVYFIDAERLPTLIQRAHLAADALLGREGNWEQWWSASLESTQPYPPMPRTNAERADRALKEAALSLMLLRNRMVGVGLVPADTLAWVRWPDWIHEPPGTLSPEEANARLEWLAPLVYELTLEKICAQAEAKTNDHMICSVE